MFRSKLVLLSVLFFTSHSASSQLDFRGGMVVGGITSQIQGDNFSGFSKFGLGIGGFVDLGFNDKASVLLELQYSQKGSRNSPDLFNGGDNVNVVKFKLDYVELPVSLNYRLRDKWSGHLGLYYGILVRGYEETSSSGKDELDDAFTNGDIGFQAGAQYHFSDTSFLRLRYSGSVLPMRDNNDLQVGSSFWNAGGYNIALYLQMGWLF